MSTWHRQTILIWIRLRSRWLHSQGHLDIKRHVLKCHSHGVNDAHVNLPFQPLTSSHNKDGLSLGHKGLLHPVLAYEAEEAVLLQRLPGLLLRLRVLAFGKLSLSCRLPSGQFLWRWWGRTGGLHNWWLGRQYGWRRRSRLQPRR